MNKNLNFKKITLFLLPVILFLIFSSCGNENNNSIADPSGTILFQKDSISVWILPSVSNSGKDTVYFSREDYGGVKIEFTLQSNADSTHSYGYWGVYTNATPTFPIIPVIQGSVNRDILIDNLNFNAYHDTYFAFGIRFYVKNSDVPYYVRIKNIKITKK